MLLFECALMPNCLMILVLLFNYIIIRMDPYTQLPLFFIMKLYILFISQKKIQTINLRYLKQTVTIDLKRKIVIIIYVSWTISYIFSSLIEMAFFQKSNLLISN